MSDKTYKANDVVSCVDEGDDGAMLYNPDKDDTVLLNPTGRIVWSLLDTPRTLDEIAGHLAAVYPGVTREQARQDAEQFIQSVVPNFIIPSPDEP
jgi:hypothetical protein